LNSYGDPVEHRLAHTRMAFSVSQRYWQFSLSDDTARTVPIEVPAQFSFADWVAGRDPALDAILPLGRYRRVLDVLKANGAEAGRPLYAEQKARAAGVSWWQPWDRDDMRHVGQDLLAEGRIQDAVAAFELNQERFPEWWRSWDGLGDAYAAAGHSARAIQAYRRALAIAPNNWNSRHEQSQIDALSRR
jgi:tetratricopeptide (TPR) repeat protein